MNQNIITSETARSKAPVSPLAEELDAFCRAGLFPYIRPCAPPGAEITTKRGPKKSDGKLPSRFDGEQWFGFPGWLTYEPKESDRALWSTWPGAGLCLVTGEICAFDVDVKVSPTDQDEESVRARDFIIAVRGAITDKTGSDVPIRGRKNSTSCAFFVRLASRVGKRAIELIDPQSGARHKIELLADGQQIVIAGMHASDVRVRSTLAKFGLDKIPTLSVEALDQLMTEIAELAVGRGLEIAPKPHHRRADKRGPLKPDQAITLQVLRRRHDWVPSIVPCADSNAPGEWRIASNVLDRDLEEDLCIYPDGIHDHGTERTHTVVSFIREFGAIDAHGVIGSGGCPTYGRNDKKSYAIVGEPDASVRRPTEAQAVSWLCRQLGGPKFAAVPDNATWTSSLPIVAAAVGLDFEALKTVHACRHFDEIADDGSARPFQPEKWSAAELQDNRRLVPALRAMDPDGFSRLEFAWDICAAVGASSVNEIVAGEVSRLREHPTANPFGPSDAKTAAAPRTLELVSFQDAARSALAHSTKPLIKGFLDQGAFSVMYGESNTGKTFVAMDVAFAISTGLPWSGMRTAKMAVVYVAAEGGAGARKRCDALRRKFDKAEELAVFFLRLSSVNLLRADADLKPLVETIRQLGVPVGLVVIDTLSRAMSGGDENASTDMGAMVKHLDAIRQASGAHVMVVHHSGKDRAKGARGHSLLRAATDTEIEIADGQISVTKQRDLDKSFSNAFVLEVVQLGKDDDGDPVTSCTIRLVAKSELPIGAPTPTEKTVLDALVDVGAVTGTSGDGAAPKELVAVMLRQGDDIDEQNTRTHLRNLQKKKISWPGSVAVGGSQFAFQRRLPITSMSTPMNRHLVTYKNKAEDQTEDVFTL